MYIKYFYEKGTEKLFFVSKEDKARFMLIVSEESFKWAMKEKMPDSKFLKRSAL